MSEKNLKRLCLGVFVIYYLATLMVVGLIIRNGREKYGYDEKGNAPVGAEVRPTTH